jgi:hypothetical protein
MPFTIVDKSLPGAEAGALCRQAGDQSQLRLQRDLYKGECGCHRPTLIAFGCEITVGSGASWGVFVPIGTGSLDGSNGSIRPGLEGMTTALGLLRGAEIQYLED